MRIRCTTHPASGGPQLFRPIRRCRPRRSSTLSGLVVTTGRRRIPASGPAVAAAAAAVAAVVAAVAMALAAVAGCGPAPPGRPAADAWPAWRSLCPAPAPAGLAAQLGRAVPESLRGEV